MQGRERIYTDEIEINENNIIDILSKALIKHQNVANEFRYLFNYEEGIQPLQRTKTYRSDINVETNCGLANQITEFKTGFHYGNPITFIQAADNNKEKAVTEFNDMFDLDNSFSKMQKIGRDCEIGGYGISYYELNTEYEEGESYWNEIPLNPEMSFIVYSSYYADHRKMMGVAYRIDDKGNRHFTCITKKRKFYVFNCVEVVNGIRTKDEWGFENPQRNGEVNFLNIIPFVEWLRSYDRMGCFERHIPSIDALNIMESDFVNDVDQNTQAVWFGVDINFPVDENGEQIKPNGGEWLLAESNEKGKPSLQPMAVPYDYSGILTNIASRRAEILENAYVPCRNDNSGGSTGVAMSDATGWSGAEMVASKQQALLEQAKMEEARIVLAIINNCPDVPMDSELKKLKITDIKPNIKRQKTYDLVSKVNALSVMIKNGIYGEDAIKTITLFDDPNEVWLHSKEVIEALQKALAEGKQEVSADKAGSDETDQLSNSPNLDSMETYNKAEQGKAEE